MSWPAATLRRTGVPRVKSAQAQDRSVRRRVGLAWGLLVLDTLTFYPATWSGLPLAIPIPHQLGKIITQGALPVALLVALSVNRRLAIRPNIFLCLATLLAIEAIVTSMLASHIGTLYRTVRLVEFVTALWLLTPWWGRRDLLLVRCHIAATSVILGSVLLGIVVAPGTALAGGRLEGALWPTPPTQVAEIAAITMGLVVVLWLGRLVRGRIALLVSVGAGAILLLTHTRTALVGMLLGIVIAAVSNFMSNRRVRKLLTTFIVAGTIAVVGFAGLVTTWLARGEDTQQLTSLTGRTTVWSEVLSAPRTKFLVIFGGGLSNQGFNGLPIDSGWLSAYNDQGLIGVVICAAMLLFLFIAAYFQTRAVQRAMCLFLVTYCLIASFTETGISTPSLYLLYLSLAASLVVQPATDDRLLRLCRGGWCAAAPGSRNEIAGNSCRDAIR